MTIRPLTHLPTFDEEGHLNVLVETPKGHRNKYTYDETLDLYKLTGVLTAGAVFPFDFGFIPSTLGGDEDPLDVLLLMDEPAFTGCLVPARVVAVVVAEQTEEGHTARNDRLIAVAIKSHEYGAVHSLDDLPPHLIEEIEHFFVSYNDIKGKRFHPLEHAGPTRALQIIEEGMRRFEADGSR